MEPNYLADVDIECERRKECNSLAIFFIVKFKADESGCNSNIEGEAYQS